MANLPVKGSIGFIIFLSIFFVSAILSIVINQDSSIPSYIKTACWTLSIGMFFCVMQCITYLNEYKKLIEQKNVREDEVILFSTCPDYWTKFLSKSEASKNQYDTVVCVNENMRGEYVGGGLTRSNAGGTAVYTNDLLSRSGNPVTIDSLRSEAVLPDEAADAQVQEGFITSCSEGEPGCHRHEVMNVYNPAFNSDGTFEHTHPSEKYITYTLDSDTSAEPYDSSLIKGARVEICGPTAESPDCASWISPKNADVNDGEQTAMRINLNALNNLEDSANKCELANKFQWSEARNLCEFNA